MAAEKDGCMNSRLILTMICMAATIVGSTSPAAKAATATQFWVYIGTNTHPPSESKGIYLYRFDAASGDVANRGLAADIDDPGWQVIPPSGKFLYTCATTDKHRTSIVAAYRIDPNTGALTFLNQQPSGGEDTPHVDVDPAGSCVVAANYGSGDISVLPINADGSLSAPSAVIKHSGSSVNPDRQKHPYPHSCNFDPSGKFVLVPDLGVDKVYIYRFDPVTRTLIAASPPTVSVTPGFGPRHMSFHPNGKFAYLINEMGGTVVVFSWDSAAGQLRALQTLSTVPPDYHGLNTSAEVHVLPNGRFLYATNRGPDDIAIFAADPGSGALRLLGYQPTQGKHPRDFAIDPTGQFLFVANMNSDSVVIFRVNPETGQLTPTGQVLHVPTPDCVTFLPISNNG
ncbi:MAG TPA: lactonase family protein [Tepidisphaeraceae bacterium]|nr:lactonase family protein [Tepidisphaeraceae bacterium]